MLGPAPAPRAWPHPFDASPAHHHMRVGRLLPDAGCWGLGWQHRVAGGRLRGRVDGRVRHRPMLHWDACGHGACSQRSHAKCDIDQCLGLRAFRV